MSYEYKPEDFNLAILPKHMHGAMFRWITLGIRPGSFGMACLENKLVQAFSHADEINTERMLDWATWLYGYAPADCWGSPEKVNAWEAHRGLSGFKDEE